MDKSQKTEKSEKLQKSEKSEKLQKSEKSGKIEKSKPISYQGDINPSAPPVHLNKSSVDQKDFIHQTSYPGLDHDGPKTLKNAKQSDVVRQAPEPPNTFHTVATTHYEQNERYCKKLHRNRRQTGSICGGLFLLLVSGLHIGWGIWRTGFWPIRATNMSLFIFTIMVWPIGATFGGFIGSALTMVLRKNIIYFIAALLMAVGNSVYIIWDDQYVVIVFGRLLTSLAHGMVFIALITQAGENASRNMSGTVVSTMNCMLYTAIFISVHVTANVQINPEFSAERILGIIALVFVLASIICTIFVTVETVPYLLRKNEPDIALENMKHLRDVTIETPQITDEMEELTSMIGQDKQNNRNPFSNGNGKPLVLMIMIRLLAALTNNFLLNYVLIGFCQLINHQYASLLIVAPRLAMSILQIFYADAIGRKIQIIVSAALAGLTLIGLGVALNTINITSLVNYTIPSIFCMSFQLFCSMGIDQMSDVCLSEAFSTAKKPWSLSFVLGIEHLFQIFMTGMAFTSMSSAGIYALLYISGLFVVVIGIILVFTLPETRGTTLKQARDLFRNEKIFQPFNIGSRNS